MAIAFTDPSPVAEASTTDATSYTTTGTAGANGKGYLITVLNAKATTPDTPTLTHAGGLTCVQVATALRGAIMRATVFRAFKTSGVSAGTFTADFAGATQTGCIIIVDELDGMDETGTDLSGAIVQSASNNGSSGTASATLATFADAVNNAAFLSSYINSNIAITEEAGYTELADLGHGTPTRAGQTEYKLGEDTSPSSTFTTSQWVCIAIEIKVDAGGGTSLTAVGGIASAEALGIPSIRCILQPIGIVSAEALGTPNLRRVLQPAGIGSAEAFGTPRVVRIVAPVGLASAEASGVAALVRILRQAGGIASAEAFGTPRVLFVVRIQGIATAEALGSPQLRRLVYPVGLDSLEALGRPTVTGGAIVVADATVFGQVFVSDALRYGLLVADATPYLAVVSDDERFGLLIDDDDPYAVTISDLARFGAEISDRPGG